MSPFHSSFALPTPPPQVEGLRPTQVTTTVSAYPADRAAIALGPWAIDQVCSDFVLVCKIIMIDQGLICIIILMKSSLSFCM